MEDSSGSGARELPGLADEADEVGFGFTLKELDEAESEVQAEIEEVTGLRGAAKLDWSRYQELCSRRGLEMAQTEWTELYRMVEAALSGMRVWVTGYSAREAVNLFFSAKYAGFTLNNNISAKGAFSLAVGRDGAGIRSAFNAYLHDLDRDRRRRRNGPPSQPLDEDVERALIANEPDAPPSSTLLASARNFFDKLGEEQKVLLSEVQCGDGNSNVDSVAKAYRIKSSAFRAAKLGVHLANAKLRCDDGSCTLDDRDRRALDRQLRKTEAWWKSLMAGWMLSHGDTRDSMTPERMLELLRALCTVAGSWAQSARLRGGSHAC